MDEEEIDAEMERGDKLLAKLLQRKKSRFIRCPKHHARTTSILKTLQESDHNGNGNGMAKKKQKPKKQYQKPKKQ